MARHDGGPRHRERTARRAGPGLAAAALAAALLVTWGGQASLARWTEEEPIAGGGIEHGTLDLRWNGDADDEVALTGLALTGMLPGDARATTIDVVNASAGSPLGYTLSARGTNPDLAGLTIRVFQGGTAANGGGAQTGYTASCTGTALAAARSIGPADVPVGDVPGPIAPGATHSLCVRVELAADAPPTSQGQAGQVVLTAHVTQRER